MKGFSKILEDEIINESDKYESGRGDVYISQEDAQRYFDHIENTYGKHNQIIIRGAGPEAKYQGEYWEDFTQMFPQFKDSKFNGKSYRLSSDSKNSVDIDNLEPIVINFLNQEIYSRLEKGPGSAVYLRIYGGSFDNALKSIAGFSASSNKQGISNSYAYGMSLDEAKQLYDKCSKLLTVKHMVDEPHDDYGTWIKVNSEPSQELQDALLQKVNEMYPDISVKRIIIS